jgi:5-formyltetrahydrofolate cyclo-ligase
MNTAESKSELRREMLERRMRLDADYARGASERIVGRLTGLSEFRQAGTLLCYMSMRHEVSTAGIVDVAWQTGKRLAVPARDADGEYRPVWLEEKSELAVKAFGIREPVAQEWTGDIRFDLAILPGVAFSPSGGRLGHGRGFIDRLLKGLGSKAGCRVGICFQCQLAGEVPTGEGDVSMDIVVTEEAVYRSAGTGCAM